MKDLMKDRLGNFAHNCIAHPLMPFLPKAWGDALLVFFMKRRPPREGEE